MKHLHRIHVMTALLIPIVSLGAGTMLFGDLLITARPVELEEALGRAKDTARQNAVIESTDDENEKFYRGTQKRLQELARRKREVRLKMAATILSIKTIGNRRDALLHSEELALGTYAREQERFAEFLRASQARQLSLDSGPSGGWMLRRLLGVSLGDSVDADMRDDALAAAREQILQRILVAREADAMTRDQLHGAAGPLTKDLTDLRGQHALLLKQYSTVLQTLDRAERNMRASQEEREKIARDTAQVQADILSMQSELMRIDGRLRARAERALVQKGLMEDRPERFRQNTMIGKGQFFWPVSGPVSAGYHNAAYEKYFGLPHQGVDIVVPFGTPVAAASDGIVFIVRLGGAKGYTYVLVGHRGGYATVYGHLSEVTVQAGDTVTAGQIIGATGGTPGTEGAGKMTTGAHLHFEVILQGEHVDPKTVLP